MSKVKIDPEAMVYPVPAAMVSCKGLNGQDNIITIAWIGTVCSDPPMLSISVRPQRHSFNMIMETKEFVVNLTNENVLFETDYCGVRSGRHEDKFEDLKLTRQSGNIVKAPLIKECPVNLECKVKTVQDLGSHHIFIAEIVAIHVNEELVNEGKVDLLKANLISYIKGNYCSIGKVLKQQTFSIKEK